MSTALENITEKTNTSVENNPIRTEKAVDIGKVREALKERFKDGETASKALDGEYILASMISTQKDSAISYILNSAKNRINELDLCSDDETTIKTYDKLTNILFSEEPGLIFKELGITLGDINEEGQENFNKLLRINNGEIKDSYIISDEQAKFLFSPNTKFSKMSGEKALKALLLLRDGLWSIPYSTMNNQGILGYADSENKASFDLAEMRITLEKDGSLAGLGLPSNPKLSCEDLFACAFNSELKALSSEKRNSNENFSAESTLNGCKDMFDSIRNLVGESNAKASGRDYFFGNMVDEIIKKIGATGGETISAALKNTAYAINYDTKPGSDHWRAFDIDSILSEVKATFFPERKYDDVYSEVVDSYLKVISDPFIIAKDFSKLFMELFNPNEKVMQQSLLALKNSISGRTVFVEINREKKKVSIQGMAYLSKKSNYDDKDLYYEIGETCANGIRSFIHFTLGSPDADVFARMCMMGDNRGKIEPSYDKKMYIVPGENLPFAARSANGNIVTGTMKFFKNNKFDIQFTEIPDFDSFADIIEASSQKKKKNNIPTQNI